MNDFWLLYTIAGGLLAYCVHLNFEIDRLKKEVNKYGWYTAEPINPTELSGCLADIHLGAGSSPIKHRSFTPIQVNEAILILMGAAAALIHRVRNLERCETPNPASPSPATDPGQS